ncbi:flagellar basal body-associated FliL family protein [Nocardioides bizhenqiangii]|uniref:Uncharacterized protein n=1 Tax=Nocardioides bizhenqiangii TaxID=3095076 RepID=A0ABZ0ZU89_9ACTN|nr:hypothetical protein [Nocardioides sp. HM61]WQQ27879.1 hypothetical protein SHK19_06505 [Nocardioides sp. HM61]
MELHESLYALGRSQGRELFNDADSFRGALDDYLDEDSASTGDINLLVDAVRLGAFQGMMSMLDSGADADRAVSEAGNRLARDRGSADVGGAMWALAVLGYATGKVSDAQVRRYRTQHASAPTPPPAGPATVLPPPAPGSAPAPPPAAPPPGAPAPTSPVWPSSGPNPNVPGSAPGPVPAASYGAPPPASYGGYGHAAPRKKRKVWPFILIGAVVLALVVGGGIFAVIQLSDGDDDKDDPTTTDGPTTPTDTGPDVTFEALNERYQSLAARVTSGMDSCAAAQAQSGQSEKVECTFPQGTLVLTTYTSVGELQAARQRRLNNAEGTIVSDVESGAYYRFDPTVAEPESTEPPILYWDSQAGVQSAELTGATSVTADQLDPAFVAVSATVTPPDGPTDIAVQDFNSLFDIVNCQRIPTEIGGETEESECRRSGRRTWVGKFAKVNDLRRYRSNAKTLAEQDNDLVVDYWYNDDNENGQQDDDEPEQGKIFGYIEEQDDGTNYGVLYIDDLDCRCYLQMYDRGQADPEKLYNLIF